MNRSSLLRGLGCVGVEHVVRRDADHRRKNTHHEEYANGEDKHDGKLRWRSALQIAWSRFDDMPNVTVMQKNERTRLGIISFIVKGAHYNLIVKLLNDRFGIQLRGGCSCAGTYGHFLLNVDQVKSQRIWNAIYAGDLSSKPGWIRLSIHPTMTDDELKYIMEAIELTATHFRTWMKNYRFDRTSNEYSLKQPANVEEKRVDEWFKIIPRQTLDAFPMSCVGVPCR